MYLFECAFSKLLILSLFFYYLNVLLNNFGFSFALLTEVEKPSRFSTEIQGSKVL